jgi:hypothetical protein
LHKQSFMQLPELQLGAGVVVRMGVAVGSDVQIPPLIVSPEQHPFDVGGFPLVAQAVMGVGVTVGTVHKLPQ